METKEIKNNYKRVIGIINKCREEVGSSHLKTSEECHIEGDNIIYKEYTTTTHKIKASFPVKWLNMDEDELRNEYFEINHLNRE